MSSRTGSRGGIFQNNTFLNVENLCGRGTGAVDDPTISQLGMASLIPFPDGPHQDRALWGNIWIDYLRFEWVKFT